MSDWDLERLVDRELKRLPQPRAPHTLMARVLEAVRMPERPWYARPWRQWPPVWQLASAMVVLAVVMGSTLAVQYGLQALNPQALPGQATAAWASGLIARASAVGRGLETIWHVLVEPLALVAVVPVLMMFAASLVFGAALGRLAFGGPSQS
jgi:hypothetical protein